MLTRLITRGGAPPQLETKTQRKQRTHLVEMSPHVDVPILAQNHLTISKNKLKLNLIDLSKEKYDIFQNKRCGKLSPKKSINK